MMKRREPTVTHEDTSTPSDTAHDPIGAYLLGALPESERIAFEAHLRDCPRCQQDLRDLGPVAALLPRLYDDLDLDPPVVDPRRDIPEMTPLASDQNEVTKKQEQNAEEPPSDTPMSAPVDRADETVPSPLTDPISPDIASPAVAAAVEAGETNTEPVSPTIEIEQRIPETTSPPTEEPSSAATVPPKRRPRGRIAPGEAPAGADMIPLSRNPRSVLPWIVTALIGALAIGAILWALALMGQIDSLQSERNLQDQQIVSLTEERAHYLQQTAAIVHPFISTTAGTNEASGMAFIDPHPDGWGGIVVFRGIPAPASGRAYQLWSITDGQLTAGPTFTPEANGEVIIQLDTIATTAHQLAVTEEPTGGSQTPSTAPIMQSDLTS